MADPSAQLCLVRDRFELPSARVNFVGDTFKLTILENVVPTVRTSALDTKTPPTPVYVDTNNYLNLQNAKDVFAKDPDAFKAVRLLGNPFEGIGRSIFMNRAAIKLANIDAVFGITSDATRSYTLDQQQLPGAFRFIDLAGGPGAFVQYLQYRRPEATGFGITLKQGGIDYTPQVKGEQVLDTKRFNIYYGIDGTGNLYTQWDNFAQRAGTAELVLADGGTDVDDDPANIRQAEFLNSKLITVEVLLGLMCTASGGTFILKVFDTVTLLSAQLLYFCARNFDSITMFKPVSSRPANAERYLICRGKRENVAVSGNTSGNIDDRDILRQAMVAIQSRPQSSFTQLLSSPLPPDFIAWLTASNNAAVTAQTAAVSTILNLLVNPTAIPPGSHAPLYIISRFLKIWNLPDNPPPRTEMNQRSSSEQRNYTPVQTESSRVTQTKSRPPPRK